MLGELRYCVSIWMAQALYRGPGLEHCYGFIRPAVWGLGGLGLGSRV